MKLEKTKVQLAGDKMKKGAKHYLGYLNNDPNWLKTINIEIDEILINREYINLFIIMYIQWRKYDGSTLSSPKIYHSMSALF